ncbi:MAG: AEC family transporter [Mogibacterium sp.]|nr:AEC family transporter [Mogibacterium sp.]
MTYAVIVLRQLIMMMIYAVVGIISVKIGVMNEERLQPLAGLVTKLILPITLFTNMLDNVSRRDLLTGLPMLALAIVQYIAVILLSLLLSRIFRLQGDRARIYRATATFGNAGYLGIPLLIALFPAAGMLYVSLYTLIDQTLMWSYGITLLTPEDRLGGTTLASRLRKLINPCIVSILLAFVCILLGIRLPELIDVPFGNISATLTPIALIYLGGTLCYVDIKDCVRHGEFYGVILGKMLVLPVLLFVLFGLFPGIEPDQRFAITVFCGLPTFAACPMVAASIGGDSKYAAKVVLMTTVAALITLPLVCLIVGVL